MKQSIQNTKILCTLGPSSRTKDTIEQMVKAGMDGARINTSHGDIPQYKGLIDIVRSLGNFPIVMDTQGPKIRLRMKEPAEVHEGDALRAGFTSKDDVYLDQKVQDYVSPGNRALIDDGAVEAVIEEKSHDSLVFRFKNGGHLTSGRSVNFPKTRIPLESLTDKDRQCLAFAKETELDYIALSFTRSKDDVLHCRQLLQGSPVKIIAKIENHEGIDHFDEILAAADGIMIARGDMGVELEPEEIPMLQKQLIEKCNEAGKLVITATQMLQSMVDSPRPTRAEASDVANAILDGSDVVMLSGETANGHYPIAAVEMMARIAGRAEKFLKKVYSIQPGVEIERAICDSIKNICEESNIQKIVTITHQGHTAKLVSRLRLQPEILAFAEDITLQRELNLYFGVRPIPFPAGHAQLSLPQAGWHLWQAGYVQENDMILFVSSEFMPNGYKTNTLQVLQIRDLLAYWKSAGMKM